MTVPGLTLAELAARQGRSEEGALELLRPFLEEGIVAERGGRLLVVDELVGFALGQEAPRERVREVALAGLAGRIAAYLERHRADPEARQMGRLNKSVRGDKALIRALLYGRPEEFVNEGTEQAHCWALAAWAGVRGELEQEERAA